ncbi:MAG: Methyltransferase type 11 [Candidatus Binatus sp.]|nr:Methyltransferase type 11 [Candidatus Binatus sp.]
MADPPRIPRGIQILRRLLRPDRTSALRQYGSRAPVYDLELAMLEPVRRRSIELLQLVPCAKVLDVVCGSGLSLAALEQSIGEHGAIVGIEQSAEMLERARTRAAENGWSNVTFVQAPVEEAKIPIVADAALFHFTHDIMRTPAAVANVIKTLKPHGRVVATGLKWAPFPAMPLNLFVWGAAIRSTSTLEGLANPWSHLEKMVPGLQIEEMLGGTVYVASGFIPDRGESR